MRYTAQKGSLFTGITEPKELVLRMIEEADKLKEDESQSAHPNLSRFALLDERLGAMERRQHLDGYWESPRLEWDLKSLLGTLHDFAPEGCYFGPHPDDQSNFGFWEYDLDSDS